MQYITVPEGSSAAAAFIMDGDYMTPWIKPGQLVLVEFALPETGQCGLFRVGDRTVVRQYCEDCFGNIYLLVADRRQKELDITVTAGEEIICLGRIQTGKKPPLPLD